MDLDVECLGVDEEESDATVILPSDELQRICRDLSNLSETGIIVNRYIIS